MFHNFTNITFSLDEKENDPDTSLFSDILKIDNDSFDIEYQEYDFPYNESLNITHFELYEQTIDGQKIIASDCFLENTYLDTMTEFEL